MKVDLIPTAVAPMDSKRNWLIYQFVRYRNFHRRFMGLKMIVDLLFVMFLISKIGLWALPLAVAWLFFTDFIYDLVTFGVLRPFYMEMGDYVFNEKRDRLELDMRILLNDLGNAVDNKDKKIQKRLTEKWMETFSDMRRRYGKDEEDKKPEEVSG